MPKKIFNSDLETSGAVKATSVTADTATISGGYIAASTLTDGTATLSGGVLTASTLTDGTATLSGGNLLAQNIQASNVLAASTIRSNSNFLSVINSHGDSDGVDNTAPFLVSLGRPAQSSGAVQIIETNEDNGAVAGVRLAYQGDNSESLGVSNPNIASNVSAIQAVNKQDYVSPETVHNVLSFGSTGNSVTLESTDTITISAPNRIEIEAGTLSTPYAVDIRGMLGVQSIGPVGEDAQLITISDGRDISIGTQSTTANSIKNYVQDGDIRFRVDTGIGSTARSSELHITSSHIYIGEDDLQNSDQANYEAYIDTRSGDITTNGEIYAFQKITAHRDLEVKQQLLVQNTTSITHAVEDVDLIAFEDYEVKLPQLEVKPSSVNTAEMYAVMIHYGSSTSTGTKKLYRSPTTGFTGSHNYLSDSDLSFNIGDVVGLEEGRLVYVGSNSTTAIGIIAYECKDPHVLTSLGETEVPEGYKVYCTASVGDSRYKGCPGFNVCNENGDIQPGDLLVTSSTPGYLMKQDDDILRSKTVGKAMEAVTFDANGQATGVYGFIYCG